MSTTYAPAVAAYEAAAAKADAQAKADAAKVALKAVDLLVEKGWSQGQMRDSQGRYCLLGSLDAARPGVHLYESAALGVVLHSELEKVTGTSMLAHWNDQPTRQKSEVLAALETAARNLAKVG